MSFSFGKSTQSSLFSSVNCKGEVNYSSLRSISQKIALFENFPLPKVRNENIFWCNLIAQGLFTHRDRIDCRSRENVDAWMWTNSTVIVALYSHPQTNVNRKICFSPSLSLSLTPFIAHRCNKFISTINRWEQEKRNENDFTQIQTEMKVTPIQELEVSRKKSAHAKRDERGVFFCFIQTNPICFAQNIVHVFFFSLCFRWPFPYRTRRGADLTAPFIWPRHAITIGRSWQRSTKWKSRKISMHLNERWSLVPNGIIARRAIKCDRTLPGRRRWMTTFNADDSNRRISSKPNKWATTAFDGHPSTSCPKLSVPSLLLLLLLRNKTRALSRRSDMDVWFMAFLIKQEPLLTFFVKRGQRSAAVKERVDSIFLVDFFLVVRRQLLS